MEELRRARRLVRWEFDKLSADLELLLKEEKTKQDDVRIKFKLISDTFEKLQQHDLKVLEQMTKENVSEEEENTEMEGMLAFKLKYEELRVSKDHRFPEKPASYPESVSGASTTDVSKLRNFKLPTIQMKKFSGELRDWLAWWAQFQKIDEDLQMNGSDKFWYLLQSLEPGTDAYEIAAGYPQSNDNYGEVIAALKKRFGNEDMLLQVYIRQLLNLVISNVSAKEKTPLKSLYIKLDSHLRALKTLQLEKADPATWLFPLVESSLPEKVLDNWQRSHLSSHDGRQDNPPRTRLELLMAFLEKEVDIKQKIDMTRAFASEQESGASKEKKNEHRVIKAAFRKGDKKSSIPSLSSFHNAERPCCVFCGKTNHKSKDCYKAQDMSYEEKIDILREKRLCFRCCGQHHGKDCKTANAECKICKKPHYTLLCREYKSQRSVNGQRGEEPPSKRTRTEGNKVQRLLQITSSNASIGVTSEVALQTVMITLVNKDKRVKLRAFIDSGCEKSYISGRAARKLGLQAVGVVRSVHYLFGGRQTSVVSHNKYEVNLRSTENDFQLSVEVREQERICGAVPRAIQNCTAILEELRRNNIKLNDDGKAEIEFLIGADVYPYIMTGQFERLKSGAVAIYTKLGWTVLGELKENDEESISTSCISMAVNDTKLATLWELETLGVKDPSEEKEIRKQVELAREAYIASISRGKDGRYVAKLPWKDDVPCLPSNRAVAYKRLQSATKKLLETGMYENYDKIFKEWEECGFIEKVLLGDNAEKIHYLPHRPVIKPESLTTPVRPVYDASCRVGRSPSLNDCLFTGENYVLMILDILLRFREKPVAFIADIKKAFQMIGLHEEDRDAVRFLWWSNKEMTEVTEYRHARVVFGVTCSPFILAAVLFHHLSSLPEAEQEFGEDLLATLYVDNCVHSLDSEQEYANFKEKAVKVMSEAAMDLRMWQSNTEDLEEESSRIVSVLGLLWDRKEDTLFVNMKGFRIPEKITKRSILSTIQKIFDPVGFSSPCLLPMKILLQRTWQRKVKWDEELTDAETRKFTRWCEEAQEIGNIRIPRQTSDGISHRENWSLQIFGDASKMAFSSAVFLRVGGEKVTVQLLCAKSRVAPVKVTTIPKLELMACLLGVRLYNTVKTALKLEHVPVSFYTDSTTALAWIRRNDQWGTFVANRVKEITKCTNPDQWKHVAGVDNPADFPSRGCTPYELRESNWWNGPKWLYLEEKDWPRSCESFNEEEISGEKQKTRVVSSLSVCERVRNAHTFQQMVRIVGWVRRFLHNKFVKNVEKRRRGPLTSDEINKAEIVFIREIQRDEYPVEDRSKLNGLEVFEDEWGVLRVKTRLTYREELGDYRYPIVLPHYRDEVKQLIKDYHEHKTFHAGVGYLMTIVRNKFWITKARHTIKRVVNNCVRCKRYSAKHVIPDPAPLPLDRIKDAEVFEVVGVDLAGPLLLKNGNKAWLVIFTCGVYRAVHFEAVTSLSTRSFIKALETFTEKYRRPAIIYSDNGTNFRGADNLFRQIKWDSLERDEMTSKIEWKFIPVTSSWWGGWWERLIRTAKDLLRRTLGKQSVNWNELKFALKSVAEVMNSRPLTHVSEDPNELEPLTPAVFLHPFGSASFPEREITEAEKLRIRLNYMKTLRRELKGRFMREYLSMIVNRKSKKPTRQLKAGELVLIGSDGAKRLEWPLGRVIENIPGRDGVCRLAKIRTERGEIVRSVQRLYPLEVDDEAGTDETLREKFATTRSGRNVRRPVRLNEVHEGQSKRGP